MQKFILSLLMVFSLGLTATTAQEAGEKTPVESEISEEAPKTGGPVMELEDDKVDYGTIEQHSEPLRVLKFTNTGTEPLIIKNARGSCGCTVRF